MTPTSSERTGHDLNVNNDRNETRVHVGQIPVAGSTVVGKSKYLSPGVQEQLPPETVGCAA